MQPDTLIEDILEAGRLAPGSIIESNRLHRMEFPCLEHKWALRMGIDNDASSRYYRCQDCGSAMGAPRLAYHRGPITPWN